MELSDEEKEVLAEAEYIHRRPDQASPRCGGGGWFKPMNVGGRNGSHHSRTLRKLERKGLIESERMTWAGASSRGSRRYRITEPGLKAHRELHPQKPADAAV